MRLLHDRMEKLLICESTNDKDDTSSSSVSSSRSEESTSSTQSLFDEVHCEELTQLHASLEDELDRQMEEILQEQLDVIENEIRRELDEALQKQLDEQMEAYPNEHLRNKIDRPIEEDHEPSVQRDLARLSVDTRPTIESIYASIRAAVENAEANEGEIRVAER